MQEIWVLASRLCRAFLTVAVSLRTNPYGENVVAWIARCEAHYYIVNHRSFGLVDAR